MTEEILTRRVLAGGVSVGAVDDGELHQLPLLQLVLALALKHRLLKTLLGSTSNSSNELVKMNLFDFRRKAPTLPPSRDTEGVYLGGCVCCVSDSGGSNKFYSVNNRSPLRWKR